MTTQTLRRRSSSRPIKPAVKREEDGSRILRSQPQPARVAQKKDATLRIIPLGGMEEVGRNMTVFEYGRDIVILDMGIQFPEEDMPGIDYIIPNINYLKGKEKNIRAIIFSHGHLDHIGAAPILLEKLGYPPIIGRDLTLAFVKKRLEDYQANSAKKLKTISIKSVSDRFSLGKFNIGFFEVEHSIMDAVGVIINSPCGTIVHPGDWTMEKDPESGRLLTYEYLAKLPSPKILMLESLGATDFRTETVSEKEMYENLERLIWEAPGRVIIGTFSSQIKRIGRLLEYAEKIGKKVALDGYSMKMNVEIAKQLGYIKIARGALISVSEIHKHPDNKVIVICTGAQGEGNAVLSRIISDNHKYIKIQKNDTIIFSSSVIPGNERTIQRLKDSLYRKCDNVVHTEVMDVHTSGHSNAQNIKEIIKQIHPDFFLPVYANHYFLKEATKLAVEIGMPKDRIFVLDNGSIIEFDKNGEVKILSKKVDTSYVFVDGLGIGDVGQVVLRDRQAMAQDGMFVIIVTVDSQTGEVRNSPDIISRGFIYMRESKELLYQVRERVKEIVRRAAGHQAPINHDLIKDNIRDKIGQFLYTKTERRPMVLPVVIEV
ncbi:ribonuclease J [Patescibacteria group bacterium]|nr:ribonuclease J [Patescibacteria group bacterium]